MTFRGHLKRNADGQWVPMDEPKKEKAPEVHSDEWLDGMECRCCRRPQIFYSRFKYLEHVKARGYEVTGEIPDKDEPGPTDQQQMDDIAEDVRRAHAGARYDEFRVSDAERENWKVERRMLKRYRRDRVKRVRPISYRTRAAA